MCGSVPIGGGSPISVQSMSNIDTRNVKAVLKQIEEIKEAGGQIVRLAVPDEEAAEAFSEITKNTSVPLVADIHFDYRLALMAIRGGAKKIRINPGNIGSRENLKKIALAAKERNLPIRVGVNSGSLEKDVLKKAGKITAEGIVESALENVEILEDLGFSDIVLSLKSSNPLLNYKAYVMAYEACDYPLHIGVTEAGTGFSGEIKSAVGIGGLLLRGIGDTVRVSLTGDPINEIKLAKEIIWASNIEKKPINIVSCPTCGRTGIDLEAVVKSVEAALEPVAREREKNNFTGMTVAVMGCEVNGPGEAKDADVGVACGKGAALIFKEGKPFKKIKEEEIVKELVEVVKSYGRDMG